MRLRTTAAAALAALALVLPTAGQSLANDHDDHDGLGVLRYRYTDDDGQAQRDRIKPADNDTCYRLTGTSWDNPAFAVQNDTESVALLFENRNCGGDAVEALEPDEDARNLEVRSVLFKPTRHHGHHNDSDDDGRHDSRHDDDGDDEDRGIKSAKSANTAKQKDLFDRIFRSIG